MAPQDVKNSGQELLAFPMNTCGPYSRRTNSRAFLEKPTPLLLTTSGSLEQQRQPNIDVPSPTTHGKQVFSQDITITAWSAAQPVGIGDHMLLAENKAGVLRSTCWLKSILAVEAVTIDDSSSSLVLLESHTASINKRESANPTSPELARQ